MGHLPIPLVCNTAMVNYAALAAGAGRAVMSNPYRGGDRRSNTHFGGGRQYGRRDPPRNDFRGRTSRRDGGSHDRRYRRDSRSPPRTRATSPSATPTFASGRKRGVESRSPSRDFRQVRVRVESPSSAGRRGYGSNTEGVVKVTPGFSDNTSAKGFERIRKRILGDMSAPFYAGPSPGPLTEANCAVFLEEKMRSMFRTLESGVVKLEPDEMVDGVWTTRPDMYTPRRVEMLSEFVQGHLATRDAMDSDEDVEVW